MGGGGGGVNIHIIMFTYRKNNRFKKKIRRAEHEYMNIRRPPNYRPYTALPKRVTALIAEG